MISEPLLEPIARYIRFLQSSQFIPRRTLLTVCDIGCGPTTPYLQFLINRKRHVVKYIGVDPLVQKATPHQNQTTLYKKTINSRVTVRAQTCNLVVCFAVLEHVNNPRALIRESVRILKKGGIAIFTTPSKKSKNILEFLAFRLGLLSSREIKEHKRYYDKTDLEKLTKPYLKKVTFYHRYFEFGLNNLVVLRKHD